MAEFTQLTNLDLLETFLDALKRQKNENKIIEIIPSETTTATVQNHRECMYLHYFRGTNFCEWEFLQMGITTVKYFYILLLITNKTSDVPNLL